MKQVELIISLIVTVVLVIGVTIGTAHYMDLRARAVAGDQRGDTISRTSGVLTEGEVSDTHKVKLDIDVSQIEEAYLRGLAEAEKNEPEIAARGDTPFPKRLRELARQRRQAIQRSAGIQVADEEGAGSEDTAQR